MAKKFINRYHVEGYLYQVNLEAKTSGESSKNPGTPYITGTIDIATDEECLNIVSIHYTYETAKTSTGKDNSRFPVLTGLIEGKYKTVMTDGKDAAQKVKIDSAIGLNEFYSDRNGTVELVSAKRNEGGFITMISAFEKENPVERNRFWCDMLIKKATLKEANEERNEPEKVILSGYIFDFRNSMLPVDFSVTNPGAMNYFLDMGINEKEPLFTQVKGIEISTTIVKKIEEESAWGEISVREVTNTKKDFVINWAAKEPYLWDDESTVTVAELNEMAAARETYIATLKQRNDEYQASKNAGAFGTTSSVSAPRAGEFKF